jgi:hypothetical protein
VIIIILAAIIPVILVLGPQLDFTVLTPKYEEPAPKNETPVLDADMQRYFELKKESCNTLSKNFQIVTEDIVQGEMKGLLPLNQDEADAVQRIIDAYSFNQTTRTYVRGDQMKRTIISNGTEYTTIWKTGRIYECYENCTMRVMSEKDSEEYYNELDKIKNNCAYFGKTKLPDSVDMSKLLDIKKTDVRDIGSSRCENFLITGNKSYALSVNATTEEEQALLWAIANFDGPVQECLDESTGIIVFRNFTLDLTDSYNLEFEEDGYMKVNQVTQLTYFTDNVPQEFFALPN